MTSLLERCQAVAAKVQQLTLAQRHITQQLQVKKRTEEWNSRRDTLKRVEERITCLPLAAEAQQGVAEKREHLRHNAALVLERLKTLDDIAQLTSDDKWARLLASIEGLTEALETGGKTAWKAHIEEQGTIEAPAWLRDRAPPTPMNDDAIAAYQKHYSVYSALTKQALPRSESDVVQMSQAIAACRAEAAKITFDVPPDVQHFFQAVQAGSATLASLTPGVLAWLAEKEQLDRYRIRSVGQWL